MAQGNDGAVSESNNGPRLNVSSDLNGMKQLSCLKSGSICPDRLERSEVMERLERLERSAVNCDWRAALFVS